LDWRGINPFDPPTCALLEIHPFEDGWRTLSGLAAQASSDMPGVIDDVPSPCIGICSLDPVTGWCKGCYRTIDEIAGWVRRSAAERRGIVDAADQRRRAIEAPVKGETSGQGAASGRRWR
jgi:predicted Fe-S protein YdhL (DUF1289 family)